MQVSQEKLDFVPSKKRNMRREKHAKGGKVSVQIKGGEIIIKPCKLADLREFLDKIEADVKSDLSEWKSVGRELLEAR